MINPIHKIREFYQATVTELKKCTWPSWPELWESTLVVIASAALLSLFVMVVDFAVRTLVRAVT
jgi:preprotein translocase subunit SecE